MKTWHKGFPDKEGTYWFYSYRYGKISCGSPCDPELILMKVLKCSNGFLYSGDGQIIWESEVEEPHYQEAILPELPDLKGSPNE